jgi:anti-sigma B factor antagonist
MTKVVPNLQVAILDHAAIIKVQGRANFTSSVSFKKLLGELQQRGFECFVLDLSECVTMDSTFLGVLAGTAVKLGDGPEESLVNGQTHLRLLNPNQRVSDLLDNLGISHLFQTVNRDSPIPGHYQTQPATEMLPSREELSRTCLEAHRTLMDLNPENIPKFKDVAQFLAEDLKRLHDAPAQGAGGTALPDDHSKGQR